MPASCHATYHYVLRAVAVADLDRALGGLASVGDGLGHVAIDGKRLRGSRRETSPGIHLLSAFSTKLQATVGTLVMPPDSAEAVEAIELIKALPLAPDDVVTGDAAFTYRPVIEALGAKGADDFLFVKANQPELQAELAHAPGSVSGAGPGDDSRLTKTGSFRVRDGALTLIRQMRLSPRPAREAFAASPRAATRAVETA